MKKHNSHFSLLCKAVADCFLAKIQVWSLMDGVITRDTLFCPDVEPKRVLNVLYINFVDPFVTSSFFFSIIFFL